MLIEDLMQGFLFIIIQMRDHSRYIDWEQPVLNCICDPWSRGCSNESCLIRLSGSDIKFLRQPPDQGRTFKLFIITTLLLI